MSAPSPTYFDIAGAALVDAPSPTFFDTAEIPVSVETPNDSAAAIFPYIEVVAPPSGCFPDTEPLYPGTTPLIEAGTYGRCPPRNFRVTDVKTNQVSLAWLAVTQADLLEDDLIFSLDGDTFAEVANAPEQIFAGQRTVLGYKIHRGTPGFIPVGELAGQGNCIADEFSLGALAEQFIDTTVPSGTTVAYLIATVVDNGA